MSAPSPNLVQPLRWQGDHLQVLDQRQLPQSEIWLQCRNADDVAAAIHGMAVRGAPAIGIAAAFGLVLAARAGEPLAAAAQRLNAARPTAVNLRWALARLMALGTADAAVLAAEAQAIFDEDLQQNLTMARFGADLIEAGSRVLTHCNTGALATAGHGTALGVIRTAWADGRLAGVYNTETRPWMQGARLTAWELQREGIPSRLIADAAVAELMRTERIDWLIVGADRIAANGDTANKIGTHTLAIVARAYGARVMVVAPSGTFDLETADGSAIPIEQRGAEELTAYRGQQVAPAGVAAFNPVFDITPATRVDALVSERGVIRDPDATKVRAMMA